MRKAAHDALSKSASKAFRESQTLEALILVRGLIKNSANLDKHLGRASASVMMSCLYGESPVRIRLLIKETY